MSGIKRYDCEIPVIAVGHGETSETTSMVKAEHYDAAVAGRKMFRDALRKKRAEVERLRADLATVKADRDAYGQNAFDLRAREKDLAIDLAESLKQQCADMRMINTLHAELAERDALLRKVREPLDLRAEFDPSYPENTMPRNDYAEAVLAIGAALSASAEQSGPKCGNCDAGTGQACNDRGCGYLEAGNGEPSAPVERDERAEFERYVMGRPMRDVTHWETWQARAALERKP